MIFQMLCHYWGIPALQVENASHRFVEISPDGGLTWRQYQLGGGGGASADITEAGWGNYRQTDRSVLKLPITGYDLKGKIEDDLEKLEQQINKNQSASTEVMHQLKNNYSALNRSFGGPDFYKYDLPYTWWILLSPQMFHQYGEKIKDWTSIIEKSAANTVEMKGDSLYLLVDRHLCELCGLIKKKKIDVHYLNWLCDLYHCAPGFLKYVLLAILQMLTGRSDSCQLKKRVKLMSMSYPLSPKKIDFEIIKPYQVELAKCRNLVKKISLSRSLLGRLSQHSIHQQLHHQPVGNSIIIPEKLMSGEAAFLNGSKSTSYKPIIFDCTSLGQKEVNDRVVMKLESGIKSEIIQVFDWGCLDRAIENLFLCWLVAHHMDETVSPIWLSFQYQIYIETAQPFGIYRFSNWKGERSMAELKLPPERLKDYFNQPSAVVLQVDDLLLLLDEFLSLIATKGNVNQQQGF